MYIYMYEYMYVCFSICIYVYICIYKCMYVALTQLSHDEPFVKTNVRFPVQLS